MVGPGGDGFFLVRVPEDQVGVGADGNRPLAGIEAKQLGRSRGDQLDEAIRGEAPGVDAARIDQAQAVLDAGAAVGDLGKVVLAHLLLVLVAEGAVVGGDHLQAVLGQTGPEFFLVPLFPKRRREDVLGSFEAGDVEVLDGEEEILGTGLRIDGQAAVAGLADLLQGLIAGKVDDVNGRAGHFGQGNGAAGGFRLGGGGAGERVILGSGLAFGQGSLDDNVNGASVFRVHTNEGAVLRRLGHRLEDHAVFHQENAGIGHKELEAGHTVAHQRIHFFEPGVGQVGNDAMEGVVDGGFALGFLSPGVEGRAQGLALVLDGEVDERGGAAEGGGDGAGLEIVRAGGAAEGHIDMGVDVDAAGNDHQALSGQRLASGFAREFSGDGRDAAVNDADVGDVGVGGGDDGAALDECVEVHCSPPGWRFYGRGRPPKCQREAGKV